MRWAGRRAPVWSRRPLGAVQAALAAALIVLAGLASPAWAATDYPPFGGSGGSSADLRCPRGQVIIGLDGRAGAAIDQISISCAPVYSDGSMNMEQGRSTGRPYGGNGGAEAHATCGLLEFRELLIELTPDNRFVRAISLICPKILGTPAVAFGAPSYDPPWVKTGHVQGQACAHFVGLHIRYGAYVDAVGAICGDVPTPPRPPAPPRKPSGLDWLGNPIPPQKPIKSVRPTPSPAPTGPPLAPRASIAGMWDLVVNGGDHYRVQIITQGDGMAPGGGDAMPIGINGIITNSQGETQYDGGFTALLQPNRQMVFTYNQKNGGHGTCQFTYSADGKTLGGTCVDQDNDTFPWTGGRAQ